MAQLSKLTAGLAFGSYFCSFSVLLLLVWASVSSSYLNIISKASAEKVSRCAAFSLIGMLSCFLSFIPVFFILLFIEHCGGSRAIQYIVGHVFLSSPGDRHSSMSVSFSQVPVRDMTPEG